MILDQATAVQMETARVLIGATMVGFLGARVFGHYAPEIRIIVAGLYIMGVLGFVLLVVL